MNVGDKVRMLRGKEEGIVTRIIDPKLIEIEIEDGFQIPVLKSEVVVVAREEASFFKRPESEQAPAPPAPLPKKGATAQEGYFIAYKPLNDRLLSVHLVNNTPDVLLFSIVAEQAGRYEPLASGQLLPRQAHKLSQADLQQFEQWPAWQVRLLPHPAQPGERLAAVLQQRVHPKAATFFRSLRQAPVLDAKAYLLALSPSSLLAPAEAQKLQETLQSGPETRQAPPAGPIPSQVDLHAEKLVENPKDLSGAAILELQLATFEQVLDRALAAGLEEITFIHGVGNGTLRKELHRRLSAMNTIAWFKDDHKEKWGYGATRVRLK
ncbi:Smr/MutS family protein [Cesiribacter andamanensis]|uniref:Recombination and DNA strand exchange inhibitor protein n=1 Tax=Cesiribacter andamanensis AMV16 TaxID=1279009 RepID=M7MYS0_9BACT|nr:Smr/MutS family protein [Cesiribacter andamanensis]EMR01608.1 recombination and DNA strand exchange inhibitor protein [Cesiribacter andamanensis AMV16]